MESKHEDYIGRGDRRERENDSRKPEAMSDSAKWGDRWVSDSSSLGHCKREKAETLDNMQVQEMQVKHSLNKGSEV
jgi:hypothetical protein